MQPFRPVANKFRCPINMRLPHQCRPELNSGCVGSTSASSDHRETTTADRSIGPRQTNQSHAWRSVQVRALIAIPAMHALPASEVVVVQAAQVRHETTGKQLVAW